MHLGEVNKSHAGSREFRAPSNDLLIGVDGRWVILANPAVAGWRLAAIFVITILDIVSVVTKPKMGRIHAKAVGCVANWIAIIAAMTHKHTFGDGSVVDFVGNAMSFGRGAPVVSPDIELPVPVGASARYPRPTVVGAALVNFAPKASGDSLQDSHLVVVPRYKAHWLPFDKSAFRVVLSGWLSPAATATVAESWFNFVCGFTRDMIGHGISASCADVRARNVRETLPGFLIGVGLHYSTNFRFCA